jgi:hypothetical protein
VQSTTPYSNAVDMEHLIGVFVAVGLVGYLIMATRFPDKF